MRTTSGWVWREYADRQSIDRWEDDGGSYDPWTGDAIERDDIVRAGFWRWFHPWINQQFGSPAKVGGYIYGWILTMVHESAYRAGLRGDSNWPSRWHWVESEEGQQQLHDAYMVGVTDEQTRSELTKLGYLP